MRFWKMDNIPCKLFYNTRNNVIDNSLDIVGKFRNIKKHMKPILPFYHSPKFRSILGPSITWKVFKKQDECIEYVSKTGNGLMPFTYQDICDSRKFLVAHPMTFWYYDQQRNANDRHSYEIIQEHRPCKLYFDLEYDPLYNLEHNGLYMIDTFIKIVCYALKTKYSIVCNSYDVLDLESTSNTKFSHHLIFQHSDVVFYNNYHAGQFVKQICKEIRIFTTCTDHLPSEDNLILLHGLESVIDVSDIKQLTVKRKDSRNALFCDEAVYTKNRHFRVYKSSKLNKNVPLLLSFSNKFVLDSNSDSEEKLFLCSLITYISETYTKYYLTFTTDSENHPLANVKNSIIHIPNTNVSNFPDMDDFINKLVYPGCIWRTAFFSSTNTITYDIINNRYCHNIRRQHKSNNVKYIVSLTEWVYYQKCYDPDCANFKSKKIKLPIDLKFLLSDKFDFDILDSNISKLENNASDWRKENNKDPANNNCIFESNISVMNNNNVPDYGLDDNMILKSLRDVQKI